MKITIAGNEPIYVDYDRGEAVKQAIISNQEYIEVDGCLIKTTAILAVTDEVKPEPKKFVMFGQSIPTTYLPEPKGDGHGYERYIALRKKLGI
jgi:hypothetical protein